MFDKGYASCNEPMETPFAMQAAAIATTMVLIREIDDSNSARAVNHVSRTQLCASDVIFLSRNHAKVRYKLSGRH